MKNMAFFAIVLFLMLSGCTAQNQSPQEQQEKIKVVVTLLPQVEFVESIGGDKVDIVVMVPPGASPHTYEPTPSQLARVSNAKLYFEVGSGVEFETAWIADIEGVNPNMKIINCSKGIKLIEMQEHHHENEDGHHDHHEVRAIDPHVWTSLRNAKIMVRNIHDALVAEDPENAEYYSANLEMYLRKLDAVDTSINLTLENVSVRKFIVFHPAWGYFARDYGLEQVAIEEAGKEPTAQGMKRIIDEAKAENITIVFASPQFSTNGAEVVADEIGGSVVLIDPLDRNYLDNMQQIANAMAISMR